MTDKPPLSAAERANRIRMGLVMAGYDPGEAKAAALINALVDLMLLAQASNWPFEIALQRARTITGFKEPERTPKPAAAPTEGLSEGWVSCPTCRRLHPEWAACLEPGDWLERVVDDPSGRKAAHLASWYGRLPNVLLRAEKKMAELFASEGGG